MLNSDMNRNLQYTSLDQVASVLDSNLCGDIVLTVMLNFPWDIRREQGLHIFEKLPVD